MIDKNRYQIWSASLSFPAASPKKMNNFSFTSFHAQWITSPVFFLFISI